MANIKYKMTGFARFIIFILFFSPIAYIGASYYNGEDGIGKIKDLIGLNDKEAIDTKTKSYDCELILQEKELEIQRLKSTIIRMNEN